MEFFDFIHAFSDICVIFLILKSFIIDIKKRDLIMRKFVKLSFIYLCIGLALGVFYREFSKAFGGS